MMVVHDLKYALRIMSNNCGFTLLTILVMATGLGLSVYLFSFMNTMIFKDLPFTNGETLVQISSSQNGTRNVGTINFHDYNEIRTNLKGLSEFSAYKNSNLNVTGREGVRRYNAVSAESNIFQLTRTKPILGRVFTDAENQVGAENVVVIGFDVWHNQFEGDPKIIDQMLRINGESHRVIGVMPQGYFFPIHAEMWIPLREDATRSSRSNAGKVYGLAHLNDGVSKQDIDRDLAAIMQQSEVKFPKTNTGISAYVESIPMLGVEDGGEIVFSMQTAAILILFLAVLNVGNLFLSRSIERGKETAIRVALGAPRSRLICQMLWESIIICSIGGIIGLLVVAWGLEVTESNVRSFSIDKPPFWQKFGIDSFTIKLSFIFLVSAILATGLLPALKNSGADFNTVLRDGTRGALGKKAGRLNRFLVISEIFLSVTVLITAGVMIVATYMATHADYGAEVKNILTAEIRLAEIDYGTLEKQLQFVKSIQSRLENSIGISDVMISSALPGAISVTPTIALEGKEYSKESTYDRVNYIVVTPGSLAKLGVELKSGRYFTNSDDGLEKGTVIVTESFVLRHFPGESPIGKRINITEYDNNDTGWLTIIGMVENTMQGITVDQNSKIPSIFRPFTQAPRHQMTIAMKMKTDRSVAVQTLRKTLASIDPEIPAFKIEPYAERITRNTAPLRLISTVFLLFGIAAVVMAAGGIFGVMSNTITQKTQEIGVKRALGASDERITREFLMMGFKQFLWGGIPGLLAGCAMGFATSKIINIGNTDLLIIAIILIGVVGAVVMLTSYLPTKRALLLEPGEALRYE